MKARDEITKMLQRFGCESVGFMDQFEDQSVMLAFKHRGRPIQLAASAKGWAAMWLKENSWTPRRKVLRDEWHRQALAQGLIAVNSILRDWVKGQVTAIEARRVVVRRRIRRAHDRNGRSEGAGPDQKLGGAAAAADSVERAQGGAALVADRAQHVRCQAVNCRAAQRTAGLSLTQRPLDLVNPMVYAAGCEALSTKRRRTETPLPDNWQPPVPSVGTISV